MAGSYQSQVQDSNQGRTFTILSFVSGAISFIFCPLLFGIGGIVLGVLGNSKGDPLAKWAIVVSVVGLIGGMIISYLLFF